MKVALVILLDLLLLSTAQAASFDCKKALSDINEMICGVSVVSEQAEAPLEASLQQFLQKIDHNKRTKYMAAFPDLNDDGHPEAIVYLLGDWCGSGGCTMLVLTQEEGSWRVVTKITITRPPIRVLTKKSKGWHSLALSVQGGGVQPGYEAELNFDGNTYPSNPTAPPARHLEENPEGVVVIQLEQKRLPLYAN